MNATVLDPVRVLHHSSIQLKGSTCIYIDPFDIKDHTGDADVICVTHPHYDHFDPASITKVSGEETILILPRSMEGTDLPLCIGKEQVIYLSAGETVHIKGVSVTAVPAYNAGKTFHTKESGWVGYLVDLDGVVYYIAGDTDNNPELYHIKCDVALLPVGGTYTMDIRQAADLANHIRPRAAVPTHYGDVAGKPEDGEDFLNLLNKEICGKILMEY